MYKKIIFIVLIMSQWSLIRSQTISRQAISNGGGVLSGGGNQITFNIGETVIPVFGVGSNLITQGFEQPGEQIITGAVSLINCVGSSTTVPFTAIDISADNIYTAQLSNAAGSFASPVNIGTLAGNATSGSINVTIPLSTPSGSGYRIRVIGSSPQTIGSINSNGTITINPIIEYTYVKEGNPYQSLFTLTDGMVIAQQSFQTSILAKPICNTAPIESVFFFLEGPNGLFWGMNQSVEPFALFDNSGLFVFGRTLPPGNYRLSTIGYSQDNQQGTITYPETFINFTIVGSSAMINMPTYTGSEFCAGNTVDVTFTTSGTFDVGNQFKVQLSDKDGNFITPIEIGTTTTAGVVNCTIPLSTPYGENYRLRVVSTAIATQNMNPSAIKIHPNIANIVSPTDDYSIDKNRKAVVQLNATNKVNSPAKVNYQAGNSIQLNAGFEAKVGTVFEAKIAGCN
jgi:hypothetical protein